jgi:uncharacterized protein YutE (UPF0331/DUF86 family)
MASDVVLNKVQVIERCIKRVLEVYDEKPGNLKNYTKQDSIILNIQRACEASIDLASHIVARNELGLPQNSRETFDLLFQAGILNKQMTERMKAMIGFRNIAVHDYQTLNLSIVQQIIEKHLDDFKEFCQMILKHES